MSYANRQSIIWTCDACGDRILQVDFQIPPGCCAERPALPLGWWKAGLWSFCPKHEVAIVADGKVIAGNSQPS